MLYTFLIVAIIGTGVSQAATKLIERGSSSIVLTCVYPTNECNGYTFIPPNNRPVEPRICVGERDAFNVATFVLTNVSFADAGVYRCVNATPPVRQSGRSRYSPLNAPSQDNRVVVYAVECADTTCQIMLSDDFPNYSFPPVQCVSGLRRPNQFNSRTFTFPTNKLVETCIISLPFLDGSNAVSSFTSHNQELALKSQRVLRAVYQSLNTDNAPACSKYEVSCV
jgi:hypothetical protein